MTQDRLNRIARDIIANNIYLTLATSGNRPWAAPLYYCTDHELHFYFISPANSLHTQHILKNPRVAFAIFDSHQTEGAGNGVQGSGTASLLARKAEIVEALKYYKTTFIELNPENCKPPAPYRLFKLTPEHLYVLDPEAKTDTRAEVFLRS